MDHLTGESVGLLQQLIRNKCVNNGQLESGNEIRSAQTLRDALEGRGLDIEIREPETSRGSIVARIAGRDPDAPSLCLMGHTDVVPVTETDWRHAPFGGELIDGEIWGRGAIDMLNVTSAMGRFAFQRGVTVASRSQLGLPA